MQFNWIFVLIAGALILAFFFGFAMKQRSLSEEKLSLTLSADLESILTSAIVSTGTAQKLPVSEGVVFECSEGCDCRFRVGSASRGFGDMVVFSPGIVKDGVVWALDWSVPYRVTNFLFVVDANTKYYFVRRPHDTLGESMLSDIVEKIPPLVDYDVLSDTDVSSLETDFDSVRFVFLNLDPRTYSLDDSFENADVSAVSFDGSFARFFVKREDNVIFDMIGQHSYFGLPLMFAAMFSYDDVMYSCGVSSALTKLRHLSAIISGRAKELQSLASSANRPCVYSSAIASLAEQGAVSDVDSVSQLSSTVSLLDRANRDALQRSCPELF